MLRKSLFTLIVVLWMTPCWATVSSVMDQQMDDLESRHQTALDGLAQYDEVGQKPGNPLVAPAARRTADVVVQRPATREPALTGVMWAEQQQRPMHEFGIGFETFNYKYHEFDVDGSKVMNLKGVFNALVLSYAFRPRDIDSILETMVNVFRAELRWGQGKVDYTGALMITDGDGNLIDTTPYEFGGKNDYMVEWRGIMGREYFINPSLVLTPYVGFGWRQLLDKKGSDPYGYDRDQRYVYMPLGVELEKRYASGWALGLNAEYDLFLQGTQHSTGLTFEQTKGNGFRFSGKVLRELKHMSFSVEPFYRYWHIEDSKPDAGYYEPNNKTEEIGVKVGAQF